MVKMTFDQEALIRSISISTKKYMFLLGAGTSASSGVPTASQCIWEWKKQIYLSSNPKVTPYLFLDVNLPNTQKIIQEWIDKQGKFPPLRDDSEYEFYVQYAYPKVEDRRSYFETIIKKTIPHVGYKALALLLNTLKTKFVWTTNFDSLTNKARKPEHTTIIREIGLDTSSRANDIREDDESAYVISLHGDYRYDALCNTSEETQTLEMNIKESMAKLLENNPLIVIGYSGRDKSIMSLLESCSTKEKFSGLYWCVRKGEIPSDDVLNLIKNTKEKGFDAYIIEINSFDDFVLRLAKYLLQKEKALQEIEELLQIEEPVMTPFSLSGYYPDANWIVSNAIEIEVPKQIYQFAVKGISTWKELRKLTDGTTINAGFLSGKVLAIGDIIEIQQVFEKIISSKIATIPIQDDDVSNPNTVVSHILQISLVNAITEQYRYKQSYNLLWDENRKNKLMLNFKEHIYYSAMKVNLNKIGKSFYLNFIPDIKVTQANGSEVDDSITKEAKRQILTKQYNKQYDDELIRWGQNIFSKNSTVLLNYPKTSSSPFCFTLTSPRVCARVLTNHKSAKQIVQRSKEQFDSVVLNEPNLIFGSAKGLINPKDIHPLRGLADNGPYDYGLNSLGVFREIQIGVICPRKDETSCKDFLDLLNKQHDNIETKPEYLIKYPGFTSAYRLPLKVPLREEDYWQTINDISLESGTPIQKQREVINSICRGIDKLSELSSVDVIVIFIPANWKTIEVIEDNNLRFDLHDQIKAYCVEKNIPTQFLKESTTTKRIRCEIIWWLSLAIYTKSLKTSYVLDQFSTDTVFVGIGFGMNKADKSGGIVLGCSHIFDGAGRGLRYQLSKIENPIWWQKNPYLSKEDALRIGTQVRQLFYETYNNLPRRVVIHKKTPFLKSEIEGLMQGLKGIEEVEMVTILHENSWRYLAYYNKEKVDCFPVSRGTILRLSSNQFLLWVHGNIKGLLQNSRSYFQGKSRIPAPVKIIRYTGHSSMEQIANEILGLSKMNLNNLEMYSKMPVTLETSSAISRIGQLLSKQSSKVYDYRLFM
jgi:NAD-dependent SIR2 family protein deacetylase